MLELQQLLYFMKRLDKDFKIKIVYLDNHVLVAKKPSKMLTQPNNLEKTVSLSEELKKYLKTRFNKRGDVFLHPVHRLDKDVSGLVLFARTSKALSRLNEQMRNRTVKKKYLALVEKKIKDKKGILQHYLYHDRYKAIISKKENEKTKKAELFYTVLEERKDISLLEIDLITGRYHQIRAQLSHIGHPILGDTKYNSSIDFPYIALVCAFLSFIHPVTKKEMIFNFLNSDTFL